MFGLSFSIRTYAEIFGTLVLIVAFLGFVHHERDVGRQQVLAADAKVVALQAQLNAQKDADAQAIVNTAVAVFENTRSQPVPVPKPVRLCLDTLSGGTAGTDGGTAGKPDDSSDVLITVEHAGSSSGFDIKAVTQRYLDEADAQVTALQAYVSACQKEGFCKATVPDAVPTPPRQGPDLGPPEPPQP